MNRSKFMQALAGSGDTIVITPETAAELLEDGIDVTLFKGVKIQDETEAADWLVCVRATDPLYYPDNIVEACFICGRSVQRRSHAPTKPKRLHRLLRTAERNCPLSRLTKGFGGKISAAEADWPWAAAAVAGAVFYVLFAIYLMG